MQSVSLQYLDRNNPSPKVASILARLGGEKFLAGIGARNFCCDESQVSFTFTRNCPKQVRLVTISVEPFGSYKIDCFGWIKPGTLTPPRAGSTSVHPRENLVVALGELTGISALQSQAIH